MAGSAGGPRRFPIYGIKSFVAARARQFAFPISLQALGPHSLHMKRMKLFAAPLLFGVTGQTRHGDLF